MARAIVDRRELPPAVAKARRRELNRRAQYRWDGRVESPAAKLARAAMRDDRDRDARRYYLERLAGARP